jgi:DNA-binding CsgD family transcriptional regulator/predicted ArsR family transcriptional regulator
LLNAISTGNPTCASTIRESPPPPFTPASPPDARHPSQLLQTVLSSFVHTVGTFLHPSMVQRLLRRIGTELGRGYHEQYLAARRLSPSLASPEGVRRELLDCLDHLKTQWGCRHHVQPRREGHLDVTLLDCPFVDADAGIIHLCLLYAGMLGEVTGERLGCSRITVQPAERRGVPLSAPPSCRITVDFAQPASSSVAPAEQPTKESPEQPLAVSPLDRLSQRECEVLRLIGEGLTDKEIAAALRVSVRTAENHAARVYNKLGIRGRARLIRFALRHHVVEL